MIDGVKILCIGTDPASWEKHPLLSFSTKVDEQTGEIKSDTKTAFFKGLHFFLIPSTKSSEIHCIIRGSLPKYYNNGRDNAYDFNIYMLRETIQDLQNRFKIDISKAVVQRFEYGVNIETNQHPKKIIRGLRAFQNDSFTSLKVEQVFNGRQIQKQEYQYKVYDKGLQLKKKNGNILRVELAVKSRKKAKKYGIEVLKDLFEVEILNRVKPDLLKVWEGMIFYDSGMKWRLMNKREKEKMLFYLDATNWERFSRKQRFRAKLIFTELKGKFCNSTTQEDLLQKIAQKVHLLQAEKGNALRKDFKSYEAEKKERITLLTEVVKRGQKVPANPEQSKQENCVKAKPPKCKVCNTDISHKKEGAIYCSKRCSNVHQSKKRRKKNRQKVTTEKKHLQRILKGLSKRNLRLIITYKKENLFQEVEFDQGNITPNDHTNVAKVRLSPNAITLHSYRARRLIKSIGELNDRKLSH